MRARLYICDCCGYVENPKTGGAFYTFRYKTHLCGFAERHKMILCHSCFCKLLEFCSNDETLEQDIVEVER